MTTPDATLDGLLEHFKWSVTDAEMDGLESEPEEAEALAAIHAHVAQREAALREERDFAVAELQRVCDESGAPEPLAAAQHVRLQMATMEDAIAETHALRAEVERLREVLTVAREDISEAARLCGSRWTRERLDDVWIKLDAALASPPPATAPLIRADPARCRHGRGYGNCYEGCPTEAP